MPAAITNIAIPVLTSKYFSDSMVVILSILGRVFRRLRAAGECGADDLSEDEFFDQHRRGQRKRQTADDYEALQHCFHGCLRALAGIKQARGQSQAIGN